MKTGAALATIVVILDHPLLFVLSNCNSFNTVDMKSICGHELGVCVRVRVRACVRACVRARVCFDCVMVVCFIMRYVV